MLHNGDPEKSLRATRCNRKVHYTNESPVKPDPLVSSTYYHRKGDRAEGCLVRMRNKAIAK